MGQKGCLESLISDEREAIDHYSRGIRQARKRGDSGSAGLFSHIRSEEVEHRDELSDHKAGRGKWIAGSKKKSFARQNG